MRLEPSDWALPVSAASCAGSESVCTSTGALPLLAGGDSTMASTTAGAGSVSGALSGAGAVGVRFVDVDGQRTLLGAVGGGGCARQLRRRPC